MKYRLTSLLANPLSLIGGIVAVVCFGASTVLLVLDVLSQTSNPYRGILAYMVFPGFMFLGLAAAAAGAIRQRRRQGPGFPILDLNDFKARRSFFLIVNFALLFLLLSALGGYKAYEFTDDVVFCGKLCHEVMEPEYTAYLNSPHARVTCVECHVGSGAQWYVKAKLSGLYQVYAALADKYPRPIPTPIENLRPAQDTCGQCHWPEKFWGDRLTTKERYSFDVTNTRREILLFVKTGGGGSAHGPSEGIHWHMNIRNKIDYLPRDTKRLDIPWVRVTYPDGTSREYRDVESPPTPAELSLPTRRMDCMDCHNRPSHTFSSPAEIVDRLLGVGKIDARIPCIKTEATAVLAAEYPTKEAARKGIEDGLLGRYDTKYPDIAKSYRREIAAAVPQLQDLYRQNFFPEMKARWSAYPNHISHKEFPGCFRCHNERHQDAEGKVLSTSCDLCHTFAKRAADGLTVVPLPAEPTLYHPWKQAGPHGKMNCWDCHKGDASPYGICGTCHDVDPEAPMSFACITCHKPQIEEESRYGECGSCHAVGGSSLHLASGHKKCADCHEAHEWKAEDPDTCSDSCHKDLATTHYPEQKCTPCHDFRGVTSGLGSAPVPPAVEGAKPPTEGPAPPPAGAPEKATEKATE